MKKMKYFVPVMDQQRDEFMSRLLKYLLLSVSFTLLLSMTLKVGIVKAEQLTGCLKINGKLSKLALGDSPLRPCKSEETEVSLLSDDLESQPVVLDSSSPEPKQVGSSVVQFVDDPSTATRVFFVFFDVGGKTILIGLLKNSYRRGRLRFESADCGVSGGDDTLLRIFNIFDIFTTHRVINDPGNTLYLERPDSRAVRTILSRRLRDGTCEPRNRMEDTIIVDPVVDLDTVFTRPFNLVVDAPSLPLP